MSSCQGVFTFYVSRFSLNQCQPPEILLNLYGLSGMIIFRHLVVSYQKNRLSMKLKGVFALLLAMLIATSLTGCSSGSERTQPIETDWSRGLTVGTANLREPAAIILGNQGLKRANTVSISIMLLSTEKMAFR